MKFDPFVLSGLRDKSYSSRHHIMPIRFYPSGNTLQCAACVLVPGSLLDDRTSDDCILPKGRSKSVTGTEIQSNSLMQGAEMSDFRSAGRFSFKRLGKRGNNAG